MLAQSTQGPTGEPIGCLVARLFNVRELRKLAGARADSDRISKQASVRFSRTRTHTRTLPTVQEAGARIPPEALESWESRSWLLIARPRTGHAWDKWGDTPRPPRCLWLRLGETWGGVVAPAVMRTGASASYGRRTGRWASAARAGVSTAMTARPCTRPQLPRRGVVSSGRTARARAAAPEGRSPTHSWHRSRGRVRPSSRRGASILLE